MTEPKLTPPPELVQQWHDQCRKSQEPFLIYIPNCAAQWGADQELEACCGWLAKYRNPILGADLKFVRRPKPTSLKEQALEGLTRLESTGEFFSNQMKDLGTIRRAIEALPE